MIVMARYIAPSEFQVFREILLADHHRGHHREDAERTDEHGAGNADHVGDYPGVAASYDDCAGA